MRRRDLTKGVTMSPATTQPPPSARSHRFWAAYLLGGLTVVIAGLLWQGLGRPPTAYAQVPDSGAQRYEMINEQRTTNQKLTEVVTLLREIRDLQAAPKKDKEAKPPPQVP
jgi:hypothetical protein